MKTVFVDLDNTLAANETCENVEFSEGLYLNKQPIQIVIDAISELYEEDDIIIISRFVGGWEGRQEKIMWIRENLPQFMWINAPFLIDSKDTKKKVDFIKMYAMSKNIDLSNCLIIDDNKIILQECKAEGIQTLYPQQIICEYEKSKGKVLKYVN